MCSFRHFNLLLVSLLLGAHPAWAQTGLPAAAVKTAAPRVIDGNPARHQRQPRRVGRAAGGAGGAGH